MKIQLDTVAKTIKIEENILLGEFIDKLKIILPKKEWRNFTLIPEVLKDWFNPIVIPYPGDYIIPTYPNQP